MTTASQIRKLVKPLLERNPDLVLHGRWLFVMPVHHILRGIFFDRTGEAARCRPKWAVINLFRPTSNVDLKYGELLAGANGYLWYWDDPEMPSMLFNVIENYALPTIRKVVSIDDFVELASSAERFSGQELSGFPHLKVPIDVARGNLKSACSICCEVNEWVASLEDEDPLKIVVNGLCPLLADNDVQGLIRQLHAWEEYTVKQLKLEKIWERTPFPIEMMSMLR